MNFSSHCKFTSPSARNNLCVSWFLYFDSSHVVIVTISLILFFILGSENIIGADWITCLPPVQSVMVEDLGRQFQKVIFCGLQKSEVEWCAKQIIIQKIVLVIWTSSSSSESNNDN